MQELEKVFYYLLNMQEQQCVFIFSVSAAASQTRTCTISASTLKTGSHLSIQSASTAAFSALIL
jgi:hypothetical protein